MIGNLTAKQRELARSIAAQIDVNCLGETFYIFAGGGGVDEPDLVAYSDGNIGEAPGDVGAFEALAGEGLLRMSTEQCIPQLAGIESWAGIRGCYRCTITQRFYDGLENDFAEAAVELAESAFLHPPPSEIAISVGRLRAKFPDPKKLGFLIMRFGAAKPYENIVNVIKETAKKSGINVVRADDNEFHADLWGNVRTHLHGCAFGIAVYERIETDEANANVGLEVGYLMAMNKPVLLLKDRTARTLQTDLVGKLYREFDPHDPQGTLPAQVEKWLHDNGIVVPNRLSK